MLRIDWDTVGRIVKRVCDAELDPGRLQDLYDIGIDEVSWKRQHKYLTLVVDHHRRQVVWGCEGSGQAAADEFFSELDPPPADVAAPEHAQQPRAASEPAIMVPFGPCPTVPAGHGIPAAWLQPGLELEPAIFARAGLLRAISMDMGPGYAKSVREHAPASGSSASTHTTSCSSPTRRSTKSAAPTGTSSARSATSTPGLRLTSRQRSGCFSCQS